MMEENIFSNTESAIGSLDLDNLERLIRKKLPASFRDHYLKYNGGIPERTYWFSETDAEPIEVSVFKPISSAQSSLQSTYQSMLSKQVIPARLLPFANDWGGNYFCLDLDSGAISYFTVDNFYDELSAEGNQQKSETVICPDFSSFVQGLIGEEDVDE
jgi:hypothetical protein